MPGEEILEQQTVYSGRVVTLRLERVQLPGVARPFTREIVEHRPAVAIVALDEQGRVYLVRQTRAGAASASPQGGGALWEVPAGVLNDGEDRWPGTARCRRIGYRAGTGARWAASTPARVS
jgi:ADP-ribose pyrophosphatase